MQTDREDVKRAGRKEAMYRVQRKKVAERKKR
jgi:hypothetical protein